MGLLDRFRRSRGDPEARELLRLVRRAKKEIEAAVPSYRRHSEGARRAPDAIARLEELERELREGRPTPELFRETERAIDLFVPRRMQAAGRPDVPTPRKSDLVQLRNKLMELAREGGPDG